MGNPSLVRIGSGGVGREILATLKSEYFKNTYPTVSFVDDGQQVGTIINGIPVVGNLEWLINQSEVENVIIAIGNPKIKKEIVEKLSICNLNYPTVIHPSVQIHDKEFCLIGKGIYIAAQVVLTTNVTIEDFSFINTNCTLQHDAYIEKFCTLMPGVRITGGAKIGEGTYISGNSLISEKIDIDKYSKI